MVCCTQNSNVHPLPVWVRPGVRVICIHPLTAGYETPTEIAFEANIEVGALGTISYVDNDAVRVVGADKKLPLLHVQLLRQDFCSYFRKALPHEIP